MPSAGRLRVVVTGASSGLGEALARGYAARGASLCLLGRDRARLEAVAASIPDSMARCADVRDAHAMRAIGEEVLSLWGAPDIVIANAGVSRGTLTEHADDLPMSRAILEANVLGIAHTFQPFVEPMRTARQGTLVGIASVAGFRGLPGSCAYSASKAAAIAWLEALRVELHGSGVRVATICPGYVDTPMTARNPYPMPFLLGADAAAKRVMRAIDARRRFAVIPWQMAIVGRALKLIPAPVYDRLFARAPRKPR